jgi:solute:Na+ symporter, SSS family
MMMLIVGFLFAHRLRKSGYTTVVDFMNDRFGKRMGMLYLVVQMLSAIGWLGGQLVALGVIVFLTTGFSMTMAILIAALVMIVVSYIGGLWALSRVDAIVLVLIIAGL